MSIWLCILYIIITYSHEVIQPVTHNPTFHKHIHGCGIIAVIWYYVRFRIQQLEAMGMRVLTCCHYRRTEDDDATRTKCEKCRCCFTFCNFNYGLHLSKNKTWMVENILINTIYIYWHIYTSFQLSECVNHYWIS